MSLKKEVLFSNRIECIIYLILGEKKKTKKLVESIGFPKTDN